MVVRETQFVADQSCSANLGCAVILRRLCLPFPSLFQNEEGVCFHGIHWKVAGDSSFVLSAKVYTLISL